MSTAASFEITREAVLLLVEKAGQRLDDDAAQCAADQACELLYDMREEGVEISERMARMIAYHTARTYYCAIDRARRQVSESLSSILGL